MQILTHSTDTALWLQMIHDAEASCSVSLNAEMETYLVFLLARYLSRTDLANQRVAPTFLEGMHLSPTLRTVVLQGVGDRCLLLSGLYPRVATKRLVRISYFVNLGRLAYRVISEKENDLYASLEQQFVPLMDVLQSIRQQDMQSCLMPLEAYELWRETGSQYALTILKQYTRGIPFTGRVEE